jgi:hypothetical protein
MSASFTRLAGICFAVLLGSLLAPGAAAKEKTQLANVQGKVQMIDRENSTLTVDMKGNLRRQVLVSRDTSFRYGRRKGNTGAWDQVKEGDYISCAGEYNEKEQLKAAACTYRESR